MTAPPVPGEWDYIIVGAGTAGCVLAARLASDRAARVLLLEAGSRELPPAVAIPTAWPSLSGSSADWADVTTVQKSTGLIEPIPRGRGMGGSSAINAMGFTRGHRSSYDAWANFGGRGWDFAHLLPYFRRSERAIGRDPRFRGTSGPLILARAQQAHPVSEAGLAAALEAGHAYADDPSGGLQEGFGWVDRNVVNGRRQSAADAYLTPIFGQRNLTVVTDAIVHSLIMTGTRCAGVAYRYGDQLVEAWATSEVVLAAGAIGSPQLLLCSGVGPAVQLRNLGISPLTDLPGVGENLHDHPMAGVVYRAGRSVRHGQANDGLVQGLLRTSATEGPDVQLMFLDVPTRAPHLEGPGLGEGFSIMVSPMLPRSRGSVRLASARPEDRPIIDPGYYSDPHDIAVAAAGLEIARDIGASGALDGWRSDEVLPGKGADLAAAVTRNFRSYHHYVGTCQLGVVVDEDLRVNGIDGLRVADASVIPSIVSGNTNAAVYAIAERAVDLIRGRTSPEESAAVEG